MICGEGRLGRSARGRSTMRLGRLDLTFGDRGCGSVYSPQCSSWLSSSIFRGVRPCRSRLTVRLGAVSDARIVGCWAAVVVTGRSSMPPESVRNGSLAPTHTSRRPPSPVQCERGSPGPRVRSGISLSDEWGHRCVPGHGHQRLPGFRRNSHIRVISDVHRCLPWLPMYFCDPLWPWP
ncbi:uncharacterized protein LY79DRAFT_344081 [Colletotrichum navitas]|uniref:Uncharacterized protein n=1 Tax=Colletotrichum navitas TaxID=681940 RepID=A0AAD8PRQ0_9PEZI|nr:uncharacterized protein LY79DRAFT_344081 [Colletotrichum navitas]KAK1579496.1 hypothetical protein LY79DRAFT_344081 [Colletotrichum navitas]